MVIRPGKTETPGVVGAAVKGADALRRGDYAGTASNVASGVEKLLDSQAKKTKLFLRSGRAAAGIAEPGKTDDSRFAAGLDTLSEGSKLAARAAHEQKAFAIAGMAGRTGRVLGHSGMMLEQVSKAKEGLTEASAMYDQDKAIEKRASATVGNFEKQIQQKYAEVTRLHAQAVKIESDIRRMESKARECRYEEEMRLAKAESSTASSRAPAATANHSYQAPKRPVWDRQATWRRLDRAQEFRRQADERAMARGSAPSFTSAPANRAGTPAPEPQPVLKLPEMILF